MKNDAEHDPVLISAHNKEHEKIIVMQCSIIVLFLFLLLAAAIIADCYNRILSNIGNDKNQGGELIGDELDEITTEMALVKNEVTEIRETLAVELAALSRLGDQVQDNELIGMIAEKIIYDYTYRALQYFDSEDYANAYFLFSRAARYQRRNSALRFYQIYSLYLRQKDSKLTSGELAFLQTGIRELKSRVFSEQEQFKFSPEEIEQKINEMEYNIEAIKHQAVQ